MYSNTEFLLAQAAERQQALVAEADRHRLLTAARRARGRVRAARRAARRATARGTCSLVECAPPAAV